MTFPVFLSRPFSLTPFPGFWPEATEGRTVETDVQASLAKMLDLTSILEAADAIARRTVLPKLLESLTTVMTKTTGAQQAICSWR